MSEQQLSRLALEVDSLKRRCDALDDLCGDILATLRANRLRGTITTEDDIQFDKLVETWGHRRVMA